MSSWIATINALDETNTAKVLRFSDTGYTDSSANYYEERMLQPALVKVSPNDGGVFSIFESPSIGEIELINADGALNYLVDYALDNGDFVLSLIDDSSTKIDYLTGKVESMHESGNSVFLTIRSMSQVLERTHTNAKYAGNNSLPAGTEGVATDIKGNVKPKVFGTVSNATPVLVNTSRLIYQFSDRATCTVLAVYDKGAALTLGTNYTQAQFSTFETTAPTAGQFNRCMGFVKLGSTPVGTVTGDCFDGIALGTSATSTLIGAGAKTFTTQASKNFVAGNLLTIYSSANPANSMTGTVTSYSTTSLVMNITSTKGSGTFTDWVISSSLAGDVMVTVLAELSPAILCDTQSTKTLNTVGNIGLYISSETTTADILNRIVISCGAHWFFIGSVMNANLTKLATASSLEITDSEIISIERNGIGLGKNSIPYTACIMKHSKIETVQQETELAGSVTAARKAVLSNQFRTVTVKDSAVLTRHPLAENIEIESVLTSEANAITVATRLLNMAAQRCDVVNIVAVVYQIPTLTIGQGITVVSSKLGYSAGRLMTLVSYEIDAKRKRITMGVIG